MTDDSKTDPSDPTSPETSADWGRLQQERDEYHDLLLRKTAELDNYKKRTERERASLAHAAAVDLITDLLPLVDDLERALAADPESSTATSYRTGVELIHKALREVLEKRGVEPIEAINAEFDPAYHEAVDMVTTDDVRDGEVIAELRRGYTLRGRLLRPSMVRVAKA
jgi:molecular chaperone GrpE